MKTETKILGFGLIATLIILFGGIFLVSKQSPKTVGDQTQYQIDYSKGEKIGSESAKVKLVEFSDFQCPACLAAEPFVKRIRENYPADVQFIYRHFPLTQHKHSKQAAIFAQAAQNQGKFWQLHDKLFETQDQWSPLPNATPYFMGLAQSLGLDETKLKQDMESSEVAKKIEDDINDGFGVGVNSTPTFLLNGRKLELGSFGDLEKLINEEIKK